MGELQNLVDILKSKSSTKQQTYRQLQSVFDQLEKQSKRLCKEILDQYVNKDQDIVLEVSKPHDHEFRFTFAGDMLVFVLHTNIVSFGPEYFYNKTAYVQQNPNRKYVGQINVYNFMADSIRHNRLKDPGYLIARIIINHEGKFFIEGERPVQLLGETISENKITENDIYLIVLNMVSLAIKQDLFIPPLEKIKSITLQHLIEREQLMGAGNKIGFQFIEEKPEKPKKSKMNDK